MKKRLSNGKKVTQTLTCEHCKTVIAECHYDEFEYRNGSRLRDAETFEVDNDGIPATLENRVIECGVCEKDTPVLGC